MRPTRNKMLQIPAYNRYSCPKCENGKASGGLYKQEVLMNQVHNSLDVLIVIIHGVTTIKILLI